MSHVVARGFCRPQLVKGFMQLYSVEQKRSQALEAHAAAFSTLRTAGSDQQSIVISFAQKTFTNGVLNSKLHVIELGAPPGVRTNIHLLLAEAATIVCL